MGNVIMKMATTSNGKVKKYKNIGSIANTIRYITRDGNPDIALGGFGVDYRHPENVPKEIWVIKRLHKKTRGRQIYHFILSFCEDVTDCYKAYQIAENIIASYFKDFQSIFALHTDTDHLHVHFIINSVSYKDGHKLHLSNREYKTFLQSIQEHAESCL